MSNEEIKEIFYLFLEMNSIKGRYLNARKNYCNDVNLKGDLLFLNQAPRCWVDQAIYWHEDQVANGRAVGGFDGWIDVEREWLQTLAGLLETP